jgi:Xaa-Pro aminopeptidase
VTAPVPPDLLMFGETYHHPNLLYKTGFLAPDPVIYIESGGVGRLFTSIMESGRARKESRFQEVHDFEEFGARELFSRAGGGYQGYAELIRRILADARLSAVSVEPDFPFLLADRLRSTDIEVVPAPDYFRGLRRRKRPDEIKRIAAVEMAGLRGLRAAIQLIASSRVASDGVLQHDGRPLTSERLHAAIETSLIGDGCTTEDTIAAGGPQSADPHAHGTGPLHSGQPIVLDIYPFDKATRYWGDLTRTVVPGNPAPELQRMHAAVLAAQEQGLRMVRPGVNGRDIHRAVCRVLHEAGYSSLIPEYAQPPSAARFIHGTGHGLGLEIHEQPSIGDLDSVLEEGDVVTVEPGLYDPQLGGVRIEDLVLVTTDGHQNLTPYPKGLSPAELAAANLPDLRTGRGFSS